MWNSVCRTKPKRQGQPECRLYLHPVPALSVRPRRLRGASPWGSLGLQCRLTDSSHTPCLVRAPQPHVHRRRRAGPRTRENAKFNASSWGQITYLSGKGIEWAKIHVQAQCQLLLTLLNRNDSLLTLYFYFNKSSNQAWNVWKKTQFCCESSQIPREPLVPVDLSDPQPNLQEQRAEMAPAPTKGCLCLLKISLHHLTGKIHCQMLFRELILFISPN